MSSVSFEPRPRLHLKVRDRIVGLIERGGKRKGDVLPPYLELSRKLGVSLVTVQRAMDVLSAEGVVESRKGKGCFVAKDLPRTRQRLRQAGLVFFCSQRLIFRMDYLNDLFRGMMLEAEAVRADVRVFSGKGEGVPHPEALAESGVDGVLLTLCAHDEYLRRFAAHGLPAVVVDYCSASVPLDFVAVDNLAAARRVVEHLIGLGHRRIGYVESWSRDAVAGMLEEKEAPPLQASDDIERREGFLSAMRACGQGDGAVLYPNPPGQNVPLAERLYAAWKQTPEPPTALVAPSAGMVPNLAAGFQAHGVKVPRDLSFAALVGSRPAEAGGLSVTGNRVDFMDAGRRAMRKLAWRCARPRPREAQIERVPGEWVAGATCAEYTGQASGVE